MNSRQSMGLYMGTLLQDCGIIVLSIELMWLWYKGKKAMVSKAIEIAETEQRFGLDASVEDAIKELNFGLVEVVYEWANGMASSTMNVYGVISF